MPKFTTILFDLDGTLIDSVRLILDSYHHTLAQHDQAPRTDDFWLAGLGTPLRVQFKPWAENPDELEAMIGTYREYNLAHHDSRVTAYPGVVELVRGIRAAGYRTGLVTSKNKPGALRGLDSVAECPPGILPAVLASFTRLSAVGQRCAAATETD